MFDPSENTSKPVVKMVTLLPPIMIVCLSTNFGGMEIDAKLLAKRLSKFSRACVFIVRKGSWLEREAKREKINHYSISMRLNFSLKAIFQIRKALKQEESKIVIYFGSSEMKTLCFALNNIPEHFVVRHGTEKSNPKKDLFHRYSWRKVTGHWAISRSMERNVYKIYPTERRVVFTNYTGQGEKISNLPLPLELDKNIFPVLKIAHIGRIERVKGQFDLLKIARILKDQGIPLKVTFFGSGVESAKLEKEAQELELSEQVFFAGHVDRPYESLGDFHAFVYPSYSEGFGNSFTEAICSGIHCFCYDNTCFPEYLELGFRYHMVRTGDLQALARRVFEVWTDDVPQPLVNRAIGRRHLSDDAEVLRLRDALNI
jgi:glycosyltransferase involved in cell wall biosynthesis